MDTQKLKDKILQLAIQGKLVDQDPSDEPASELLKKIETEKKKLYREGKIRKPKKLPPIKEEEKPFDIPESWEWVRLGEIISIKSGDFLPRKNMIDDGEFPVYGGNGINGYYNRYNIKEKQIIIGRVGYYCGNVHLTKKKSWITDNAFITYFDDKNIYKDFLVWLLRKTNLRQSNNATAQPVISGRKIYPIKVPMPPLNEQKRIVKKIDELFKLIDNLDSDKEKLLETIEITRNKVLQDAIQGKLVAQDPNDETASELLKKIETEKKKLYKEGKIRKPKKLPPIKEEEKPFDIPESWEWVRMGNSCHIIMGQSPKGNTVGEEGIEFHQGKIFFGDKYLKESDKFTIKPKKIADIGDVILSVRAPVGTVNITERQICIGRGLCAVKPLLKIKTDFNYYWIKAFNETLLDKSTGTTFKAISMTTINELVIPLPPINEQIRVVEKIEQLFKLIDNLDSDKEKLLEIIELTRKKVLQDAIQGKLVEQDPNDEPASELLKKIESEKKKLYKEGKIRKPKKLPPIKDEEKPFDIPESWEWVKFGNVVDFKIGKTPKRSENKYWEDGIYSWVSISDLEEGKVIYNTEEKVSEQAYHEIFKENISPKGTLVMSFKLTIGKMSILGKDAFHNEAIISIFPYLDSNYILRDYIFKIFKGLDILMDSKKAVKGATLNTTSMNNIILPLPPSEEQKRIAEKIDMIFDYFDLLERLLRN